MSWREKVTINCKVCGLPHIIMRGKINNEKGNTCSHSCSAIRQHQLINQNGFSNPNWKGGISTNNSHYQKIQRERHPFKNLVRRITQEYVYLGKINKKPCLVCNDPKSQAHHLNYFNPYFILWLCRKHHTLIHKRGII